MSRLCGLTADELDNNSSVQFDEFYENGIAPASPVLNPYIWTPAYNYIYQANAIIEGLSSSKNISPATINQLMGEALFIRAFNYFYLVNIFGGVPLVLETDYRKNAQLARSSVSEVYSQIIADLKEAQDLLLPEYPSVTKGRINLHTANALLSRVFLYNEMWEEAEEEATKVIESGMYSLPTLNNVFLSNSSEAIWQLIPVPVTANTNIAGIFVPATANAIPPHPITPHLLDSFEEDDLRKTAWLGQQIVSGNTYYYPLKYKVRTGNNVPVTEYNIMIRLGELYLIRAEARIKQEKLTLALQDIDKIRERAGLPLVQDIAPAADQSQLQEIIMQERRIEFMCEWGHRWFDLKRTGTIDQVLSEIKAGWVATAALYPIPAAQLMTNYLLTQNPGYN